MPESGKDKTGDAALEGLKESDFAFSEVESDIRLANLNAVLGRDGINSVAVELKGIQSSENFPGRTRCAGRIRDKCT